MKSRKTVEQVVAAIQALDLEPIKFNLMDAQDGQGWSREHADRMETAYKRYLALLIKYPDETIAPTKDIDKFWHGHILDTMKYTRDCENVFGYFLHHFPYFGLRGEQDAKRQLEASDAMHRLYEQDFGEPIPAGAAYCMAAGEAKKDAAYCMAAKPVPEAAYGMAAGEAQKDAAYCMAAKPVQEAAYCMAAKPVPEAAYCMAAGEAKKEAAYCMAAKPGQEAAYCMAAKPQADAVDVVQSTASS